ncbi:MAG: hypothetical protein WCT04_02300 [Planctomycetota bacterium]
MAPPIKISKAGEGGGLPKGLSLFRFILFSSIMLGGIYGGASMYFNALPIPGDTPPPGMGVPSAMWEPSPVWLPSWLMIRASILVRHDPDGYRYSSQLSQAAFASLCIFLGMLFFGAIGWNVGEAVRTWWVRNRDY